MNDRYYVSTGPKNGYYTLRHSWSEATYANTEHGPVGTGVRDYDYHVRNLSTDRAEAIAKAKEITGKDLSAEFDLEDIRRQKARRAGEAAMEREAKAKAALAQHDLMVCWEIAKEYRADTTERVWDRKEAARSTIHDIVNKLVKYGSISDKQAAYLRSQVNYLKSHEAIVAQRAAEKAAAADCPAGRVQFSGTVVSRKLQETQWGTCVKWVVKSDAGYCVYVTAPANAQCGEWVDGEWVDRSKGLRVEMIATLEPSKDDPKFGFGKRPKLISQTFPQTGDAQPQPGAAA